MARINTNVPSLVAQFNLSRTNGDLDIRLTRLATGLRINRGADDPAGLIVSERIGTDLAGVEQAIKNGERASSVIATTEAALGEVTDLLNSIKALLVESANTGGNSKEEREANQLAIDSAIQSITRISNTASFGGLRLLDGSLDYVTSGVAASTITKAQIFGASFIGTNQLQVEVDVLASAQRGAIFLQGNDGTQVANGALISSQTIQVTGNRGVQEFSFPSGTPLSDIVTAVNSRTSLTGVTAELVNGSSASGIQFSTEFYGTSNFVSVERVTNGTASNGLTFYKFTDNIDYPDATGGFDWTTLIAASQLVTASRDIGRDVTALVNGSLANGDGLTISLNSTALSVQLQLDAGFASNPTLTPTTFDIVGGGSLFQLGPEVTALQQTNIGVPSMAATKLGGTLVNGGLQFLSSLVKGGGNSIEANVLSNDFSTASDIIEAAIDEVTVLRGRLGAFERNVLDTNRRSLQSSFENLAASRSVIMDADFAAETAQLSRAQILQSSGTTVLGIANQRAQSVLQLLG